MRVNEQNKSMDIEPRDINYILPAYVRLYLFQTKNQDPEKIIFPMFRSVPHPFDRNKQIPIEYVPDTSPVAVEIAQDGNNIKESPGAEAKADEKEAEYERMKKRIAELEAGAAAMQQERKPETELEASESPAMHTSGLEKSAIAGVDSSLQPTAERLAKAKQPDNPVPPGSPADYGGSRDAGFQKKIAKDLKPEKEVNEDEERGDEEIVKRAKKSK